MGGRRATEHMSGSPGQDMQPPPTPVATTGRDSSQQHAGGTRVIKLHLQRNSKALPGRPPLNISYCLSAAQDPCRPQAPGQGHTVPPGRNRRPGQAPSRHGSSAPVPSLLDVAQASLAPCGWH